MQRRALLKHGVLAGTALLLHKAGFGQAMMNTDAPSFGYQIHQYLPEPSIIQQIRLVEYNKELFVWVADADGAEGIAYCNQKMVYLRGIFEGLIVPFFLQKDARNVATLVDEVYKEDRNYKFGGMPFWNAVGHLEIAIWDMLGKKANKPVHAMLGKNVRTQVPVYISSLTRDNTAEEEGEKLLKACASTGSNAVKIKIGARMANSAAAEKRSKELLQYLRKHGKADLTIYADANSSYTVPEALAILPWLEDMGVAVLEEPTPWESFENTLTIGKAAKKIRIAGGEQNTSYPMFEWYCKHNALHILQPDVCYNGGLHRGMQVAMLAQKTGKHFAPHSPKADPLEYAFLQLAAVAPALYGFQEFPLSGVAKKGKPWWGPHFTVRDGKLSIPTTAGLGADYAPELVKSLRP